MILVYVSIYRAPNISWQQLFVNKQNYNSENIRKHLWSLNILEKG